MKTFFKSANYILAFLLVVAAVALAYIAVPVFGNKALIVRSGSMEPTIKTGDLIVIKSRVEIESPISQSKKNYKEGDVIAYKSIKNPNVLTTHRIVSTKEESGKTYYQTQGDANNSPDSEYVTQDQILGKSTLTIPKVGKIFAFAKTKQGFALLVLIPAISVILAESLNLIKEILKTTRARKMLQQDPQVKIQKEKLLGPIGLRVLLPLVISMMFFNNSFAYFSDSAQSANNTFTASANFPTPTPSPTPSPSPQPFANHLVLSEVQITGGSGNTNHDFIELYNPTNSAIDLNGLRLVKRSGNSPNDSTIKSWTNLTLVQPNGYYLWASNGDSAFPDLIGADTSTGETIAASNTVAIRNGAENSGTIIDVLSWNEGSTLVEGTVFTPNPGANQSMERKAYITSTSTTMSVGGEDEFKGNSIDTNNNANDFFLRSLAQPQNSLSPAEIP